MRRLLGIVFRLFLRGLATMPAGWIEGFVVRTVVRKAGALPPDEALRFLFRIDAALYPLQGEKAVEYEGGTHPKHRHTRYHDFFVSRILPGERVLDIGCGNGALAYDVAERGGAFVVGMDLDPKRIAEARERYAHQRVEYRVGDVLMGIPEGPFQVVILSNLLEHVEDRPGLLRWLRRDARPLRFLIRVPLFERDWRVPLRKELGVEWRLDLDHQTEYTLESFAEEMEAGGLSVTYQEVRWGEIWAEAVPR